jgi:hypothetical protein
MKKLLIFLLAVAAFPAASGQQDQDIDMEIVARHYSSGYLPVVDSYVEYEVRLENNGEVALEDNILEVSLVSNDGIDSSAAYSVPLISPGGSMTLHLGPFKMEGEGDRRLVAELEGASLRFEPDSFTVYRQEATYAILIAIPLIAAGAGIVGFSIYRKRRAV